MVSTLYLTEGVYAYLPKGDAVMIYAYGLQTCLVLVLEGEHGAFVVHVDTPYGDISGIIKSAIDQLGQITDAKILGGESDDLADKHGSNIIFDTVAKALNEKKIRFVRDEEHSTTKEKLDRCEHYHCDVCITRNKDGKIKVDCFSSIDQNTPTYNNQKIAFLKGDLENPRKKINPMCPCSNLRYTPYENKYELPKNINTARLCENRSMFFAIVVPSIITVASIVANNI